MGLYFEKLGKVVVVNSILLFPGKMSLVSFFYLYPLQNNVIGCIHAVGSPCIIQLIQRYGINHLLLEVEAEIRRTLIK